MERLEGEMEGLDELGDPDASMEDLYEEMQEGMG